MNCIYFLAPTLASTHDISEDLRQVGIEDFYLHVISQDQCGVEQRRLQSGNYLETLDVLRDGFIGAMLGLVAGLIGVGLLMYFQPFAAVVPEVPTWVYAALAGAGTLFGAWEGGLIGIASENRKLARFHDDIVAGKYLILVYVRKHREALVRKMMEDRHPEAELAAIDSHFINPFSRVARLSRQGAHPVNP